MKSPKKTSKSSAPKSKLTKRTFPSQKPAISEEPASVEQPADEEALTTLPDPEIEDRKINPNRYKSMPVGKIAVTCGCGIVAAVHVDDPDIYDAKTRQQLFIDRGASYDPPLCTFCFRRQSKAKRERLAS